MTTPLRTAVARALQALAEGTPLGETLASDAFSEVMRGEASAAQIAGLLMGLRARGEREDEVVGIVRALRGAMVRVPVAEGMHPIDTCGTGGGTVSTFNVSTAAAFVAVAGGAAVAKHGNRSYTSKCGSADLLEALGVAISVDPTRAAELLSSVGMAFLFAPAFHPATAPITPVRRQLAVPTIMNLIGPLANPAGTQRQVIGVWDASRAPLVARVLARLDGQHALVVHARVGMDEISPVGLTDAWEIREGRVRTLVIDPSAYGLAGDSIEALAGGTPEENASRVERLLHDAGADQAGRNAVGLNAGAALYVAGVSATLDEAMARAVSLLEAGEGAGPLERLRAETPLSTSESLQPPRPG